MELSKQEIELSKQEMDLFLLLPDLQSKNFFYKKFLTFKNESKTGFWKQEIELSKQEMELTKQKMELFLPFPELGSKNFFNKISTIST